MKKAVSNLALALAGGLVAVAAGYFLPNQEHKNFSQLKGSSSADAIRLVSHGTEVANGNAGDFTLAAEKSLHAVVHIRTTSEQVNNLNYDPFAEWFFGPQKRSQNFIMQGSGSGVIISDDGYIVTNNHVVANADKIEVTLNDKRNFTAKVIGTDASTDIALLKIEGKDLPVLVYGNSDAVKVGEWVLAVGNPFNLNSTVTAGIISAKGRNNILNNGQRTIESFIQTDAAVNPGNSGGALVNTFGELVGINTAIASNDGAYQGYSFAIPVNIVKKVVSDLVEFGEVQRAYIGVSIQDIDAKFAAEKNLSRLKGVYINALNEGGSAQEAGMQPGDVIIAVREVPVSSVSELQEQISRFRPGDKVDVTVERNNKELVLPVVLKTLDNTTKLVKKAELEKRSVDKLGVEFQDVEASELEKMRLENGVRVSKLRPGKFAQVGIRENFIITSIDRKKVSNAEQAQKLLENKSGNVLIEGNYANGVRASYSFVL
ncbi:MAG TPA: Do family serine endopeptidase [Bacteroidia bacterium]|nr:Do family serine endopeptidase [Bacteroidia bacterium]